MNNQIYAGARAPEAIDLTITSSAVDLTTVTVCQAEVISAGVQIATWSFSIVSATSTALLARHVFASDGSEVATPGPLLLRFRLTTPSGVRRAKPKSILVILES